MTARFRATIARSTFPACCFLAAPAVAEIVRPVAPPPPAVCTRRGRDHDSRPVSSAPNRRSQPIPGLRSPSGLLGPFRIKAFPGSLPESLPSESARLLFAPRNRFYKIAAAADHRSELATFPWDFSFLKCQVTVIIRLFAFLSVCNLPFTLRCYLLR
jgi:hypothetical protein